MSEKITAIIKVDSASEHTVGEIKKIHGDMKAKFLISIIDTINLDANPRESKEGPITYAIQETIETDPDLFFVKTKGILLGTTQYETLDRGRYKLIISNPAIEGLLDGGHNTLAIGLYVLKQAMDYVGTPMPKKQKNWNEFIDLWKNNRDAVSAYVEKVRENPDDHSLDFYIPVEIIVPRDPENHLSVEALSSQLIEICAARNNNAQLQLSSKVNQKGYLDSLKKMMYEQNELIANRLEWKTNDGGDIKIQNLIALAWIPLSLIDKVKDENEREIEPVSPVKLYSSKGMCLTQFDKLMESPDATIESNDYRRELKNREIVSAFQIAVQLPELYDYIYEEFPALYNRGGGKYGAIDAVKNLNEKAKVKQTPYKMKDIDTLSPEGFIIPFFYGIQALMEKVTVGDHKEIRWKTEPWSFLHDHLPEMVKRYMGIISMGSYDPQKVGKAGLSYDQGLSVFMMASAGLI